MLMLSSADMAKLADAQDSGSCELKLIWVQVPLSAPKYEKQSAAALLFQYKKL